MISNLPSEFSELTSLENLNLWSNTISGFPFQITHLKNLRHLTIACNSLPTEIPIEFYNLKHLESLTINADISLLSPQIANLQRLERLSISSNRLEVLPSEIGSLVNLEYLDLSCNIRSLPIEIKYLSKLSTLGLFCENLTSLPPEIGNLINLKRLEAWGNNFYILPKEIGNLINLQELFLDANYSLNNLPDEISHLINLRVLSLYECDSLKSLPNSILALPRLEWLNLPNSISALPVKIKNMKNLQGLSFGGNGESLKHLKDLENLVRLEYGGDCGAFPIRVLELRNLKTLRLYCKNLKSIPPEISQLIKLRELFVPRNSISQDNLNQLQEWLPYCNINGSPFKKSW